MAKQTDLLLGQCYEKLDEPDRQLDAYARVVAADPTMSAARLGKGMALESLNRIDEARVEYEQMMALPNAPMSGWTACPAADAQEPAAAGRPAELAGG